MLHSGSNEGIVTVAEMSNFLEKNPNVEAISSHHFHGMEYKKFLNDENIRFLNLTLIRNPISRIISMYKYYRRSMGGGFVERAAREHSLFIFIEILIQHFPQMIDNAQVNIFASHGFYMRSVSRQDFEVARNRLETFSLSAPVERYDEAMVTVEYFNSALYAPQSLDLSYRKSNVSMAIPGEESPTDLMGKKNFDWLKNLNVWDESLHKFSNDELDRRIAAVPDFEARLKSFRDRCRLIENTNASDPQQPARTRA
jgi:hypothetical protein